jgi:hypothetical protein
VEDFSNGEYAYHNYKEKSSLKEKEKKQKVKKGSILELWRLMLILICCERKTLFIFLSQQITISISISQISTKRTACLQRKA